MAKYIFIGTLLVASAAQGLQWFTLDAIDRNMWANQVKYVEEGDIKQYDPVTAYGHPGGPIIIGSIGIRRFITISHEHALSLFLTVFNGIIIGAVCTLCFLMRKKLLWWLAVLVPLSMSQLYTYATPPSAVASLLIVLLSILTLSIHEKENVGWKDILLWGVISGLAIATRADIGSTVSFFLLLSIALRTSWKKAAMALSASGLVFILTNPFMWSIPIQHIQDLVTKVVYHYAEFAESHIRFPMLITISFVTFVSIALSIAIFYCKRKLFPIPIRYFITVLIMTIILYAIFLTSHYQAPRYFIPMIFIWESLLPLFLLSLVPTIHFSASKPERDRLGQQVFSIGIVLVLAIQPIALLVNDLRINSIFP